MPPSSSLCVSPLLYFSVFDYPAISVFLIYLNDSYTICIFELFSGLTFVKNTHHMASVSSFAIVHDTHILADIVHWFSQTYNFNSQHIKRQCSYPVFPWYFDTPWRFHFAAHCHIFLFPLTSVNTDSIIYLCQFSVLSCKFRGSFLPNDRLEVIKSITLLRAAFSSLVKIMGGFKWVRHFWGRRFLSWEKWYHEGKNISHWKRLSYFCWQFFF